MINHFSHKKATNIMKNSKILPTYSDNKIIIGNFLREKKFGKILEYTEYDLKSMIYRHIMGINLVGYIFENCDNCEIIFHFIDNILDFNALFISSEIDNMNNE